MAPPPGEQNGGETTAADASRSLPTPFLTKTYQLVDDHSIDDVISWNEDGSTFIVWNPTDFAKDLLPKYFKHNNYSSFVRQLNTYGFRKVVPDRWEFSNECFRRGEKRLLCDIQRRKIATTPIAAAEAVTVAVLPASAPLTGTPSNSNSGEEQVISSNSPPPAAATPMLLCREYTTCGEAGGLIDENERLRKENTRLSRELSQMKNLYSNIHSLMSNFANNQQESNGSQAVRPLDLLPSKLFGEGSGVTVGGYCVSMPEDEMNPRLFGVQIGAKRSREGEREGQQPLLRLQLGGAEVKCEPLDHRDGSDDLESPWLRQCNRTDERACS